MIEVGEYVRNNEGYIGKIEKIIYDKQEKQNYYSCEKHNVMASGYNEQIVKHSKNIIDLIEEDDIGIMSFNGLIFKKFITQDDILELKVKNYKLLRLVTKEQFKSVEYIVKEEQ